MLNAAAVATALAGLVGCRATADYPLTTALIESRSGLYVQDKNELLTLDVLQHVVPSGDTLEDWLAKVLEAARLEFAPRLAAAQGLSGRVLLSDGTQDGQPAGIRLVKNPGRKDEGINKLGQFVGLEMRLTRYDGVSYTLPQISLQLDGALTQPLPLYLYTDTQAEPVATFDVPMGNKPYYPLVVPLTDIDLSFGQRHRLWLGYYEDDLPLAVRAIRGTVGPCGCPDDPFTIWSRYAYVRPFAVAAADLADDRTLFDYRNLSYGGGSFGLNPYLLGYCDVATVLKSDDNQATVAPALLLAYAIRLLSAIIDSSNITQITQRTDLQADAVAARANYQAELYGGKDAAGNPWPGMLGALELDLSGLDSVCQKQVGGGIIVGTILR